MTDTEAWIATEAAVTSCRFQFARLNTLTLGIQAGEKFCITFDYYAQGRLYSDEFQSAAALPQSSRISLTYNPLHPEQNSRSSVANAKSGRTLLVTITITGSVLLSIVCLAILRGCS